MSVQFGRHNFKGRPIETCYLARVDDYLAPHGPDAKGNFSRIGTTILHRAFHTTRESLGECQPLTLPAGEIFTWCGRLDNRDELTALLRTRLSLSSSDLSIAAAAYVAWGIACFPKLIGDWALSVWSPVTETVLLAKDFLGTQRLFYCLEDDHLRWSSVLEALVLPERKSFSLSEEYLAGWFSHFPAEHLTPYIGIDSLPAACSVTLGHGKRIIRRFWDFDAAPAERHRSDADYEEHFRTLFSQSVARRLRSSEPVLAELSGGVDSSAIVCVADAVVASSQSRIARLDTISYFNEMEPNWNERPYFEAVEKKRGQTGCQVNLDSAESFLLEWKIERFLAWPGPGGHYTEAAKRFAAHVESGGYRVLLSGIGGDEVTGGVPTPIPELTNYLAKFRLLSLWKCLQLWALERREPWIHLLSETLREFFPESLRSRFCSHALSPWLTEGFLRRNRKIFLEHGPRLHLFGRLPSFEQNLETIGHLRRALACELSTVPPVYEKRYPFLDRDLLQFLFTVPREQLVRPGQRRSLMRRALVGIVPDLVLSRKRKAYIARMPLVAISSGWKQISEMCDQMLVTSAGMVSRELFLEELNRARQHCEVPIGPLLRVLGIESWLRSLERYQIWDGTSVFPSGRLAAPTNGLPSLAS